MDESGVVQVPLAELRADDDQPRQGVGDRRALEALKASMQDLGRTVQYITVTARPEGGYRIISGHRRAQAARELGWVWLPAIVVTDVADVVDRRLRQIAENSARAALKPTELCQAIEELRGQVEPARIASTTGVSLRTVYNYLGILEHPDLVAQLSDGRALRAVLAEVAARHQAGEAAAADAPAPASQAKRNAARRAQRSVARLRAAWDELDGEQRRSLATSLQELLASLDDADVASAAPSLATLHVAPPALQDGPDLQ